jgi:hypothetical protein
LAASGCCAAAIDDMANIVATPTNTMAAIPRLLFSIRSSARK